MNMTMKWLKFVIKTNFNLFFQFLIQILPIFVRFNIYIHLNKTFQNINSDMGQQYSRTSPQLVRSNTHQDQKGISSQALQEVSKSLHLKSLKHRSIGKIVFTRKNNKYSGTVTILSKDFALTSAHNIYSKKYSHSYTNFKVLCIGEDGGIQEYGIEAYKFPQKYFICPEDESSIQCDYALIKLSPNSNYSICYDDFLKISAPCKECLMEARQELPLQVYGYISSNPEPLRQFGLARKNSLKQVSMEQSKIQYNINTFPGQSGAPIIINGNEVIGIHKGTMDAQDSCNFGTLVSYKMLDDLKKWTEQLGGNPIKIKYYFTCSHFQDQMFNFQQSKPINNTKQLQQFLEKKQKDNKLIIHGENFNTINLSNNKNIKILILNNNNLKEIDVSKNNLLQVLRLDDNQIETIVFPITNRLRQIGIQKNRLRRINVANAGQLMHLDLSYNLIASIDLSNNRKLVYLDLAFNELGTIDLINTINLLQLSLSNNRLKAIDLKEAKVLIKLFITSNQLRQIDLSNNPNVLELSLKDNKLERVVCWYQNSWQAAEVHFGRQSSKVLKQCVLKLLHYKDQSQSCSKWAWKNHQKLGDTLKTGYSEVGNTKYVFELEERN